MKTTILLILLSVGTALGQFGPSASNKFPVAVNTPATGVLLFNQPGETNYNLAASNALEFLNAVAANPLATPAQLASATNLIAAAFISADTTVSNALSIRLINTNNTLIALISTTSNGLSDRLIATNNLLVTRISNATNDLNTTMGARLIATNSLLTARITDATNDLNTVLGARLISTNSLLTTRITNATNDLSTVLLLHILATTNNYLVRAVAAGSNMTATTNTATGLVTLNSTASGGDSYWYSNAVTGGLRLTNDIGAGVYAGVSWATLTSTGMVTSVSSAAQAVYGNQYISYQGINGIDLATGFTLLDSTDNPALQPQSRALVGNWGVQGNLDVDNDVNVDGNVSISGTLATQDLIITNALFATNYTAADFVPTAGYVKFVGSNNAIYSVSTTKTNLIVAP